MIYSQYWLYSTPTSQIAKIVDSPKKEKINNNNTKTSYDNNPNLQSASKIKKYKNDVSMPLYLKGYVSVPSLGIYEPIHEGTSPRALANGAGTVKYGQNMDNIGNYAIASHNMADWYWGHSFAQLQLLSNVNNLKIYTTDGKNIYTYQAKKHYIVDQNDSMKYTTDAYGEKILSEDNKNYTNQSNYQNGAYLGKDITLYTCYTIPPDYYHAENRIIVMGVQTEKVSIENTPENLKSLFPDLFKKTNDYNNDYNHIKNNYNKNNIKINLKNNKPINKASNNNFLYNNQSLTKIDTIFKISLIMFVVSMITIIITALIEKRSK